MLTRKFWCAGCKTFRFPLPLTNSGMPQTHTTAAKATWAALWDILTSTANFTEKWDEFWTLLKTHFNADLVVLSGTIFWLYVSIHMCSIPRFSWLFPTFEGILLICCTLHVSDTILPHPVFGSGRFPQSQRRIETKISNAIYLCSCT